jgi:alpha-glucosidase
MLFFSIFPLHLSQDGEKLLQLFCKISIRSSSSMHSNDSSWWRKGVFYHIYLRSYSDSKGDGLGDLPGLISRLDHLNGGPDSLGIDAIWLSPCYPSPDKDFGYDVADYCDIDPRYGTLQDFDLLIKEAHRRGIKVILDLVFNHSSDQHPWFLESRRSRENPKRNWYIWRDPAPGQRPPNNWQSVFGGKAWEWDATTQQYYYHMFLKEQADLNWRNPDVRSALMDVTRFWLERGVDGFRLDVFNLWFKHADLLDNPPKIGLRGFDRQEHLYDVDQPEMHNALAEFRRVLDSFECRTSVGELFGRDPRLAASYSGHEGLHMVFNFAFTWCRWQPAAFQKAVLNWEMALGSHGWPCYVLSNHDGPRRHVSRYGGRHPDEVAKVASALLLTLRGTPFLYYGEEIGMPDVPLRRDQMLDPLTRRYWPFHGRDQARTPMQWDSTSQAGFTSGQPWLPVHPNYRLRNVEQQRADPHSVLSFYRSLLRLRQETPALHQGSFEALQTRPAGGLAYLRRDPSGEALIALNFEAGPCRLRFDRKPADASWSLVMSSDPDSMASASCEEVRLGPFEAAIFLAK